MKIENFLNNTKIKSIQFMSFFLLFCARWLLRNVLPYNKLLLIGYGNMVTLILTRGYNGRLQEVLITISTLFLLHQSNPMSKTYCALRC